MHCHHHQATSTSDHALPNRYQQLEAIRYTAYAALYRVRSFKQSKFSIFNLTFSSMRDADWAAASVANVDMIGSQGHRVTIAIEIDY
jgi:hypothetical protein